jgi:hypothetical protein
MTFLEWYAFVILPLIVLAIGGAGTLLHGRYLNKESRGRSPGE